MKKTIFFLLFLTVAISGCATTDDLKKVQSELDYRITVVDGKVGGLDTRVAAIDQNVAGIDKRVAAIDQRVAGIDQRVAAIDQRVAGIDQRVAAIDPRLAALKTENTSLRGDVEKSNVSLTSLRKSLAETGADATDIRDNLQQLRGQLDGVRKDLSAASARAIRKDEEYKEVRERLESAVFKINFLENFLGLGKREDQAELTEKGDKTREVPKGKTDKESAYAAAYELFKNEKFDKAREAFQNFMKQYPDTEYSDNAQFWIGECYYFEKKYENAILEYEKVNKNFPDGDKMPYALLKQGIAFLNLGDKASAKLVLQRVIKDYPNTNQARTAKATLLNIK